MELKVLRHFVVVARMHSFSQAAVVLRLSQPALSRQIKSLEDELNTPLFERHRRELVLTTAGTYLYDQAQTLLEDARRIETNVPRNSEIASTIRIYCPESPATPIITRALSQLAKVKPDVHITLIGAGSDPDMLSAGLENDDYDFVVCTTKPHHNQFNHLSLDLTINWSLLVPKTHPFANRKTVNVDELGTQPVWVPENINRTTLEDWLGDHREKLSVRGVFNLETTAISMVSAGLGLAFYSGEPLNHSDLTSVPLTPIVSQHPALVWRKGRPLSETAETFLGFFRK